MKQPALLPLGNFSLFWLLRPCSPTLYLLEHAVTYVQIEVEFSTQWTLFPSTVVLLIKTGSYLCGVQFWQVVSVNGREAEQLPRRDDERCSFHLSHQDIHPWRSEPPNPIPWSHRAEGPRGEMTGRRLRQHEERDDSSNSNHSHLCRNNSFPLSSV